MRRQGGKRDLAQGQSLALTRLERAALALAKPTNNPTTVFVSHRMTPIPATAPAEHWKNRVAARNIPDELAVETAQLLSLLCTLPLIHRTFPG